MAASARISHEERKRIITSLVFFFRTPEARTAVHNYVVHMPQKTLREDLSLNGLFIAAEMCNVFEESAL